MEGVGVSEAGISEAGIWGEEGEEDEEDGGVIQTISPNGAAFTLHLLNSSAPNNDSNNSSEYLIDCQHSLPILPSTQGFSPNSPNSFSSRRRGTLTCRNTPVPSRLSLSTISQVSDSQLLPHNGNPRLHSLLCNWIIHISPTRKSNTILKTPRNNHRSSPSKPHSPRHRITSTPVFPLAGLHIHLMATSNPHNNPQQCHREDSENMRSRIWMRQCG